MADFELELQLTARIDDLERGMKDAQRAVETSSKKMETATKEASEKGMNPLLKSGLKLGAGIMVATGAINIALRGTDDATIQEENLDREIEKFKAAHRIKIMAIEDERVARINALRESNASEEESHKLGAEIISQSFAQRRAAHATLKMQEKILKEKLKQAISAREESDLAKEAKWAAERQAELAAQAEAHHEFMLELGKEQKKKDEERLKIEEQRLELVKKISNAEQEIAKAKADASLKVSQATATFSTAGGSFTTGASAELNEAKLLTKISTASKELLAEIVRNTAGIGAGLV
jgi:hypothetical protein